jgi:hypothetical protein
MKSPPRTYELQVDDWVEVVPQPPPRSLLRRLAALLSTAFAVAAIAAVGVVAAGLALVLLPFAVFAAWRLRAASRIETRRPR